MKLSIPALTLVVLATTALTSRAAFVPYLDYDLRTGSFADVQNNGPALSPLGGTFGNGGYAFGANQGLTLSNGLTGALSSTYSIALRFEFDTVSGYRKMLDFKNRGADNGLYNLFQNLNFYPFDLGTGGSFEVDTPVTVVLTRDNATGSVVGYTDGVKKINFTDGGADAVFNATNNIATFFADDTITDQGEASPGTAFRIQVYREVLTPTDVAGLDLSAPSGGAVVTPGPGGLLAGLIGMGCLTPFVRRRRAKSA